MNICTVCNNRSQFPINFSQFAPTEKLAFVERVCGLLIESRFRFGNAAPWDLDIGATSLRNSIEQITGIQQSWCPDDLMTADAVSFARHYMPEFSCSCNAIPASRVQMSRRNFVQSVTNFIAQDQRRFTTRSMPARGSPGLVTTGSDSDWDAGFI